MSSKTINVQIEITDQEDGTKYKGKIDFGDCLYKYNLLFSKSISELKENNLEKFLKKTDLIILNIKGKTIPLDKKTNEVLKKELLALALEHYHHEYQQFFRDVRSFGNLEGSSFHGDSGITALVKFISATEKLGLSREYGFSITSGLKKMAEGYYN